MAPQPTAAATTASDDVTQEPTPPDGSQDRQLVNDSEGLPSRPPPKKRRRIVISCTECHRRKQKCDRELPCANCVSRNKQDACRYETGAPTAKKQDRKDSIEGGPAVPTGASATTSPEEAKQILRGGPVPSNVVDFGYSYAGASTLGFLKQIDKANPGESLAQLAGPGPGGDSAQPNGGFGTKARYKNLIRQLPAREYLDKLVDMYFREFNWQYYALDQDVFMAQMDEWNTLPFNLLTTAGPHGLSPDLRAFPALLFQVLAVSLLALPRDPDPEYNSIKYNANMTFEDLAMDYSESGVGILSLLGKRQMSLTTVLAGFVRVQFLKYSANVTEAWHAISSAIRDAQEIGIHRDSLDPKPKSDEAEAVLENQWEIQRRRRMWMTLVSWDLHTGIVLGRPLTVDNPNHATMPVDAPIPTNRSKTPVRPRGEDDPPTPLTRAIWSCRVMGYLRDILDLEREGPCPKSFAKVEKLHAILVELDEQTPPFLRMENPDTRWDSSPECYWLPWCRSILLQVIAFDFMALHRPYIFTRQASRREALKACLSMLQSQRLQFQSLKPEQYRTFSLFFGTFDAIVLMASIYILFPNENGDLLDDARQHFGWGVERFEAMSVRNSLARAARSVLHAIYLRLKKALGNKGHWPCHSAPVSMDPALVSPPTVDTSLSNGRSSISSGGLISDVTASTTPVGSTCATGDNMYAPGQPQQQQQQLGGDGSGLDFNLPPDFDWSSIQPLYAMGDLVYNDLMGISEDGSQQPLPVWNTTGLGTDAAAAQVPWQFDGNFNDNSLWNLFNEFTPP